MLVVVLVAGGAVMSGAVVLGSMTESVVLESAVVGVAGVVVVAAADVVVGEDLAHLMFSSKYVVELEQSPLPE